MLRKEYWVVIALFLKLLTTGLFHLVLTLIRKDGGKMQVSAGQMHTQVQREFNQP
jgi:hypothetical protein